MNLDYYLTNDLPIPYKNLKIYPVKVLDYVPLTAFSQCLTLDKNSIPDAKIIAMTDLEYIFYSSVKAKQPQPYLLWFDRLLSLCLKDDDTFEQIEKSIERYEYDENGKPFFKIGNIFYNSSDFIEIKNIICEQNLIELPDETVSKEVRDSLEKAKEYKRKLSGEEIASFEDYIVSLSITTGWTLEYVYSMTVRKFIKSVRRMDNYIHYKIYLTSSLSGMVEFKDKSFIKHWLSNLDKGDAYKDVTMNLEDVQNKISLDSAKN